MGMGVDIKEVTVVSYITCPSCEIEVKVIDLGEAVWGRKRLFCPSCGADLGVDGHHTLLEKLTSQSIDCPGCGIRLELTVSSFPHKNMEQYCPACGVAAC